MAQVAQRGLQPKQMADAEHRLCYTDSMLKRSLARTNPYLRDPGKRRAMFQMTVSTSTDIEGVKLSPADLLSEPSSSKHITLSREPVRSSRLRR
jgi:hypothetical protein